MDTMDLIGLISNSGRFFSISDLTRTSNSGELNTLFFMFSSPCSKNRTFCLISLGKNWFLHTSADDVSLLLSMGLSFTVGSDEDTFDAEFSGLFGKRLRVLGLKILCIWGVLQDGAIIVDL